MTVLHRRALLGLALSAGSAAARPQAMRMAFFDQAAPLSYRDGAGEMAGLLVDLVNWVGRGADLRFSHHGYPWVRAQAMVRQGELDALCTNATDERRTYALFCDTPLLSQDYGLFHRIGDPRIAELRGMQDLHRVRVGAYRGSGYAQQQLGALKVHWDSDPISLLRRIALGDLDVFVDSDILMSHRVRELGLDQRIAYRSVHFLPRAQYRWGLRRSYPDAVEWVERMERSARIAERAGDLDGVIVRYL